MNTISQSLATNGATATVKIARFACDAGNRRVKYGITLDRIRTLASVYRLLEQWDDSENNQNSVTLTYSSGCRADLLGKRWTVGEYATDLGGIPAYEREKGDPDVASYLILGAIASALSQGHARAYSIGTVIACLPDDLDERKTTAIRSALVGTHQLEVGGKSIAVRVGAVEVRPENLDAYRFFRASGTFAYPNRLNGIVDAGGGNITASLFSQKGRLMRDCRIVLPGTYAMAQRIAVKLIPKGLEAKGMTPQVPLILDAIADMTYRYGSTGYDFSAEFIAARDEWVERLRTAIKTQWQQHLPNIGQVAIIGGSAILLTSISETTKGRFFVSQHCHTATARGMLTDDNQ